MWSAVSSSMAGSLCAASLTLLLLLPISTGSIQCPEGHCHPHATCTTMQTEGSFKCRCDTGYQGNGHSCWDIDECANDSTLCENGACVNKDGGYECDCDEGLTQSSDGRSCLTVYPVGEVKQVVKTDHIELRWPQPSGLVAWYSLSWWPLEGHNSSEDAQNFPDRNYRSQISYISPLHPGRGYKLSVAARFLNLTKDLFTIEIRTRPLILSEMTITEERCTDYDECDNSLKVEFTPTPKSASQFDKYRFRLEGKDTETRTLSLPADTLTKSVVFRWLVPGRLYNITMWTVSRNVISDPVRGQEQLSPRPITQVNFTDIGTHEVTLTWDKPAGDYTSFHVEYLIYQPESDISLSSNDPDDWIRYRNYLAIYDNSSTVQQRETSELGITVGSLHPHTHYDFLVSVFSDKGFDGRIGTSKSLHVYVTTLETLPPAPHEFDVLAAEPRALNFSWRLDSADVNGVLHSFLLEYAPTNDPEAKTTLVFPFDARGGAVADLVPGDYWFSVHAETGAGAGPAARLLRRVDLEAPLELSRTSTTVTVSYYCGYSSPIAGSLAAYTLVLAEQPRNDTPSSLPSWHDVHALEAWPPYQVTKPQLKSSSVEKFTIGLELCDVGSSAYCNGPLKPDTKYYVKLRVFTGPENFTDSAYTVIRTDSENHTTVIISTVSLLAFLILLAIIAITILCRIKYKQPSTPRLPTCEKKNPFYLNLLFRAQCAEEIAKAERPYDEVEEHDYYEID